MPPSTGSAAARASCLWMSEMRLWASVAVLLCASGIAFPATDPPLVDAARNADTTLVRTLVAEGADVDAPGGDGSTALLWASYHDDAEGAGLLLAAGADVDGANDLGATPLWAASQNGSEAMVALLLEAGADPNRALLAGETPLMVAARSGYAPVVRRLIALGADVDARGARDQTALMWAAAEKHPDVVEALLAGGADIQARSEVWSQVMAVDPHGYLGYNREIPHGGDTALMFAARSGDLASMKLLVAAGADVDDADAWGVSATTLAAHSGFTEVVEFLLSSGADPNAAPNGFTALHEAIMRRDERMVASLLAHGADANAPLATWTPTRRTADDWYFTPELVGATPFWLAARFTQPAVMRLLVGHGADPLVVHRGERAVANREGTFDLRIEETTALMASSGMGGGRAWVDPDRDQREALTLEAVRIAVGLGVDVNASNADGRTALDAARSLRFQSVIDFLVANGAESGTEPEGTQ